MRSLSAILITLAVWAAGSVPGPAAASPSSGFSTSRTVDGSKGGKLSVGRFTVEVPAGAFQGEATVTLQVADRHAFECSLEIEPASANAFLIPVTLAADVSDLDVATRARLSILNLDPATGKWKAVPGSRADAVKGEVSAPLRHFSIYGVGDPLLGRSGW